MSLFKKIEKSRVTKLVYILISCKNVKLLIFLIKNKNKTVTWKNNYSMIQSYIRTNAWKKNIFCKLRVTNVVTYLLSGVWIIFSIELERLGSFRGLWWYDSLGLASNKTPSGTDIPSLFNMLSANRSARNAESGILPPKYGNKFSWNNWRFCCEEIILIKTWKLWKQYL